MAAKTALPHDLTDLGLAPVVLALDAQLDQLAALDLQGLAHRVALESDRPDWTLPMRSSGLLESIRHGVNCHGWELSWDPRGVRLTHENHSLVLGIPSTFTRYLAGETVTVGVDVLP